MTDWTLYVLVNNSIPIYVGVSSNIEGRLIAHKSKGKEFNCYLVIETFKDKSHAFAAERSLIKYLSIFGNPENLNGKYVRFESLKPYLKK